MKVCIDPGHGGKELGALGNYMDEKDINLKLALLFGEVLEKNGVLTIYTRKEDKYLDLQKRCDIANKNKCDYFISFHCNEGSNKQESGIETYFCSSGSSSEKLAKYLHQGLLNISNARDRGIKEGNFHILKNTNMPSILMQIMFISNQAEEKKLIDELWQRFLTNKLAYEFLSFVGINIERNNLFQENEHKIRIMGTSLCTSQQMENFLHSKNSNAPYIAKLYLSIGEEEGVRGDIAFAQTLIETNYFKSIKCMEDYNFIGINITDPILKKAVFDTPSDGIKAHIQHLKAYGSTERLKTSLVDPIFHLVPRGISPNWLDLDYHWIVPKENYGKSIIDLWQEMICPLSRNKYEFNTILSQWRDKGIITDEIELDKPLTWKDFIIVQNQLSKKE